ncbi:MAG: methyltransferase domain-containing protein [Deltaproteobacteria bacterium]|nr:methyltransferase domain-containing protein [Deltaproteobacteria bacterium]
MRKDYRPVSQPEAALDEAALGERFWTRHWDREANQDLAYRIERDDKFKLADPYLSSLPASARVLDAGCGLGQWTVHYTQRGFEVYGLDICQTLIEKLKGQHPHCRFVAGDLRQTEFEDGFFEACFSWGTFEHLEEGPGAYFREARRILKPGGLLLVTVPFQRLSQALGDRRPLRRWDDNYDRGRGYACPMRFYQWRLTKPELAREFEINGFEVLKVAAFGADRKLRAAVKRRLRLDPEARFRGRLVRALKWLAPRAGVAHMIIGVGRRRPPQDPSG